MYSKNIRMEQSSNIDRIKFSVDEAWRYTYVNLNSYVLQMFILVFLVADVL